MIFKLSYFPLLDILNEMRHAGLESIFICSLMGNCQRYEGIRDLMEMWFDESDSRERDKIIADLQEVLEDIMNSPQKPQERPYLFFNDLSEIKREVIEFKKHLREEVDRQGGICELARKTGIPQPSLSRFFNSTSMPRSMSLYKIAKALNLPESAIGFKWANKGDMRDDFAAKGNFLTKRNRIERRTLSFLSLFFSFSNPQPRRRRRCGKIIDTTFTGDRSSFFYLFYISFFLIFLEAHSRFGKQNQISTPNGSARI